MSTIVIPDLTRPPPPLGRAARLPRYPINPRRLKAAKQMVKKKPVVKSKPVIDVASTVGDTVGDTCSIIIKTMTDPNVFIILVVTGFMIMTHINDPKSGPIRVMIEHLKKNNSTKYVGEWVETNIVKLYGLILFLPTLISVKSEQRILQSMMVFVYVVFGKALSVFVYGVLSVALLLYNKLPKKNEKFVIMSLVMVFCYFEFADAALVPKSVYRDMVHYDASTPPPAVVSSTDKSILSITNGDYKLKFSGKDIIYDHNSMVLSGNFPATSYPYKFKSGSAVYHYGNANATLGVHNNKLKLGVHSVTFKRDEHNRLIHGGKCFGSDFAKHDCDGNSVTVVHL